MNRLRCERAPKAASYTATCVVLLLATLGAAPGQTTLTTLTPAAGASFGKSVANGGAGRVIVGQPTQPGTGVVAIHNAATGQLLSSITGLAFEQFGQSVAAVDVTASGARYIIVGAPAHQSPSGHTAGRVVVYDGNAPHQFVVEFGADATSHNIAGACVAAVGDVDGDGVEDFAFGIPQRDVGNDNDCGRIVVKSGLTLATLWTVDGTADNELLGTEVAGVGDVNGDGRADFAGYGPRINTNNRGIVRVWSGATGGQLWARQGTSDYDFFGLSISKGADFDSDGLRDIVLGAPGENPNGRVHAVRGLDGTDITVIASPTSSVTPSFGTEVAADADLDNDGRWDILVGDEQNTMVHLYLAVPNGGAPVLFSQIAGPASSNFGGAIANLGDVTNDWATGPGDLLVIIPEFAVGGYAGPGSVTVLSAGAYTKACAGLTTTAPQLTLFGSTAPSGSITISSRDGSPQSQAYLVVGHLPTAAPISGSGGCVLYVYADVPPIALGPWDASGNLVVPGLPPPGFSPFKVFLQLLGVQNNQIVHVSNGYVVLF